MLAAAVTTAGVIVTTAVLVLPASGSAGQVGTSAPAEPESPAQRAGVTEHEYIDRTSLAEVPGSLVTPVAALDRTGRPLPDSAKIVRALRARDGRTVIFATPTIVDFGHLVAGVYTRPGATADPVSAFPNFFRTVNPGETGQLTLADGDWYVARYVQLPAHVPIDVVGFRFTSGPDDAPATLAVPGGRLPGAFLASDQALTAVWYAAASTMQLSMMTTIPGAGYQFYDGPERDRKEWLWYDASADDTAYYAFGALALPVALRSYDAARGGPGAFVVSPDDGIPDQNGFTERDLAALYRFYGDTGIVRRYWSDLIVHEASVARSMLQPDGLYRTNVLPVPPNPMNPARPTDESMAIQMWEYAGFLGMRQLAAAAGESAAAAAYLDRANRLRAAVDRTLWSPSKGAFVDFIGSDHVDEAGNAMAVLYGLAGPSQDRSILAYLHAHNDRLYSWATNQRWGAVNPAGSNDFDRPFLPGDADLVVADWRAPYAGWGWDWGMGSTPDDFAKQYNYNYSLLPWAEAFEVQADFTAGEDSAAIDLVDRAFGTMVRRGPSTLYESSRYDGAPAYELGSQHGSVVHRWASGVGALLQEYVLGIKPATPGFTTWRIEPHGGDLGWAQGRVPTPEGPLSAWWEWTGPPQGRRGYTLEVAAPRGTSGSVVLPVPSGGVVRVDGRAVGEGRSGRAGEGWSGGRSVTVISNLGSGNHLITWSR